MKLTELQKQALIHFVEKTGETPKNYGNGLHALYAKKLIGYKTGRVANGKSLTDAGEAVYSALRNSTN